MVELFDMQSDMHNKKFIHWVNTRWNIEFKCARRDIDIYGSPERALARVVIQDKNNTLFLLEKFPENKFLLRENIAQAIEYLNANGLDQALPYRKTGNGDFLPFFNNACFQLSLFLKNTGVRRPEYLASKDMGENFALFLLNLSRASADMGKKFIFKPFSIKTYIYNLFKKMEHHDADMYTRYLPFLNFLEKKLMSIHDSLPVSFCHGDLHPLNVIWDSDRIAAVIDWEFAGIKPDIYDAANLVGCAGIEDPQGLQGSMVMAFIDSLKKSGVISPGGWEIFPEYILALRFAWLSEWLRKKDEEMLELEACYMDILVNNMDALRQIWKI